MSADSETLGNHQQLAEAAAPQEIVAGVFDFAGRDDADGYEGDQVNPNNYPVDGFNLHFQNAALVV